MRIIALPLPNQRVFLHCYPSEYLAKKVTIHDKIINRIYKYWDSWSASKSYTKQKVVSLGNRILHATPYEENFLRAIAPVKKLNDTELHQTLYIEHPPNLESSTILAELNRSKQLQKTHTNYLIGNIIGLPLTIPFILIPLIPNIPGFYLCYRAYCNFRAIQGSIQLARVMSIENIQMQESEKLEKALKLFTNGDATPLNALIGHPDFVDRYKRAVAQEQRKSKIIK
ncbi:mitochondrial hydrogen/potassium transport system protein [Schizosaccharomyces pombe]|uniref:Uncharacterized protein C23H3.12c n=1 Tax=Schizosaccharomyces pombe (strain 972 / ATCC 24843) TaxID=284812 RepID=YEPC_SCHPO|nr:putative hydrogen/potassium transport protein [Schizosaccharomyces pombe]O13942.1 RecName: Full=Uncharacterized protein C23H3.12c [Schizosaccharomyces pombe 972h-]CAB16238.1 mitochondrial hydrogen/potassium transport system protein (predicted) [Schizosaccharomyces pombe]|eukprot:NP_593802.1 putative hydrogen/potassium transport protein [Schizosaccharomyces pombe]